VSALASLSIDLDGARHYRSIHGLPPRPEASDPFLGAGLSEFLDLCAELELRATLFVVTEDLARPELARLLTKALSAGHELASHSHRHDYALSTWGAPALDEELGLSVAALERFSGERPLGFRAPGYNLSEPLVAALERAGFRYDASLLPSLPYFVARAALIALKSAQGRPSASLTGDWAAWRPQAGPYFPQRGDYRRAQGERRALLMMPMSAPLGLPWIGTTVGGAMSAPITALALRSRQPIDLELHPIDLTPASAVDEELLAVRRDLQVPLSQRRERLRATLLKVCATRVIVPLREVAQEVTSSMVDQPAGEGPTVERGDHGAA